MGIFTTYSVILLLIILLAFILAFTNITNNKYLFIFIVTISISILGMFFNPVTAFNNGDYTDLYRFYQTIDSIHGLPFNNNVLIFQEYNNIPVMKVILFLISRVGINNLLPFIFSFIFYGVFGVFIVKICERYKLSNKLLAISFCFFICIFNFKMVISNIRCPVASAIFILTLYYDLFRDNKNILYLLGYLVCCGIHPIFILFSGVRFIFELTNGYTDKIFYCLILFYNVFINFLLSILSNFTSIEFFNYLHMKLNYYLDAGAINSSERLVVIFGFIYIFILIYYLFVSRKKINKLSLEEKFYKLSIVYILFTVGSCWNFVIFQRCTWLLIFFILYWYLFLKSKKVNNDPNIIYIYDIVMFFLVCLSLVYYFFTYQYGILTF